MTYIVIYNTLQLHDIGIIKLGIVKLAGSHGVIRVYSRGAHCEGHSIKRWKQRWRYKRFKGCAMLACYIYIEYYIFFYNKKLLLF